MTQKPSKAVAKAQPGEPALDEDVLWLLREIARGSDHAWYFVSPDLRHRVRTYVVRHAFGLLTLTPEGDRLLQAQWKG